MWTINVAARHTQKITLALRTVIMHKFTLQKGPQLSAVIHSQTKGLDHNMIAADGLLYCWRWLYSHRWGC